MSKIEVKGRHYPQTMQASIIVKAIGEDAFEKLYDDYRESRNTTGANARQATDADLIILNEYRKGASLSDLARRYGKSITYIQTSIRIAALVELDKLSK